MRRMLPLSVPRAFSTPIVEPFSKMKINNADTTLTAQTSSIMAIISTTLLSSKSSQAKSAGYSSTMVVKVKS